ncbi:hypothetical protein HZA38_04460 [Candidatus Peregrinibacteria bacterium]|nr:hypothetical protein [Candidatus Peregrinibacteria bacterium]
MKKLLSLSLAVLITFSASAPIFAAEDRGLTYSQKTLYGTITKPKGGEEIAITAEEESKAIAELIEKHKPIDSTFDIQGTVGPNKTASTYITTPMPEEISNFHIDKISGDSITFAWNPRPVFNYLEQGTYAVNSIRNMDGQTEVPHFQNDENKIDYSQVVKRNKEVTLSFIDNKKNPRNFVPELIPPNEVPQGAENIHSTEHSISGRAVNYDYATSCTYIQHWNLACDLNTGKCPPGADRCLNYPVPVQVDATCEYDVGYTYFWQDLDGKIIGNKVNNPNVSIDYKMPLPKGIYEFILWMEVKVNGEENPHHPPISFVEQKRERIAERETFRDWNDYVRIAARAGKEKTDPPKGKDDNASEGGTKSAPDPGECPPSPICDPTCFKPPSGKYAIHNEYVLVDDFETYEIWYNVADESESDHPYLQHLGVTRNPEVSHKIDLAISDPRITEITVPFTDIIDDNGKKFDPSKTYYFSLFEIQRMNTIDGKDQSVVPVDLQSATNDAGYLFAATTPTGGMEIKIENGEATYPEYTNAKIEVEMRGMTAKADQNGVFEIPDVSYLSLNPASTMHSIFATYLSDDTKFASSQDDNALYLGANRDASFFKTQALAMTPPLLNIETEPYGTIYDSWTKEPVKNAEVRLSGLSINRQGVENPYELIQETGSDGFFSFFAAPGKYVLEVLSINNNQNTTYTFPTKALLGQCENIRKNGDGIYTDVYCRDPLENILIADKILHYDIPIDPTVRGENAPPNKKVYLKNASTGNIVDEKIATPQGKFSFFVPLGTYTAEDENGNLLSIL